MLGALALGAAIAIPALSVPFARAQQNPKQGQAAKTTDSGSDKDVVIFRSGRTVEGKILDETPTNIRMKVTVAGISAETTYDKNEILSITRAAAGAKDDAPEAKAEAAKAEAATKPEAAADGVDVKKVYKIELTGTFGEDISQTPIRQAVKDAQRVGADYIIVVMDNDWSQKRRGGEEKKDDDSAFDELFRSEQIDPIFNEEIPRDWQKPPTVVFWVKKAMGGAAFLPLNCPVIYFSNDGKMGGVGHLEEIFGQTGDQIVREKQFALRLGHAEGKAIKGGYDPRIVKAMARTEYVLSYRMVGGKAELLEQMPEGPDEFLLTDDGDQQAGHEDTEEQLARGEGNDNLTLTAKIAYDLGVSKGTVDSIDDLIFQLGLSRNSKLVNEKQSDQIMKSWRDGLENARRALPRLLREYQEVQVKPPGMYQQRTQARGARKHILEEMQGIEKRYEEALNPHRIPPGLPDWNEIEILKRQIDLEQQADKPEKK
jgi:hypothetical protein